MSSKLYVGNIPFSIQESDLETEFGKFGQVKSVKIITDFETGRSKGFGFIEMETAESAKEAIRACNEKN